jgi:hypothetical protein
MHDLTGLDVGEGQARTLLCDLRGYQAHLQQQMRCDISDASAALRWTNEVLRPGMAKAHEAVGGIGDPVQAYCDLLEVRWLLSEAAARDVGDTAAIDALRARSIPPSAAATMVVAEATTGQLTVLTPELEQALERERRADRDDLLSRDL